VNNSGGGLPPILRRALYFFDYQQILKTCSLLFVLPVTFYWMRGCLPSAAHDAVISHDISKAMFISKTMFDHLQVGALHVAVQKYFFTSKSQAQSDVFCGKIGLCRLMPYFNFLVASLAGQTRFFGPKEMGLSRFNPISV